jgi:hypothetical protein
MCFAIVLGLVGAAGAVIESSDTVIEVLRGIEQLLQTRSSHLVRRTADSKTVTRFEADVDFGRRSVPVAVTVYKRDARAEMQVMTHDISREDAERLEDELAALLRFEIVERSNAHTEQVVRAAAHNVTDQPDAAADRRRTNRHARLIRDIEQQ